VNYIKSGFFSFVFEAMDTRSNDFVAMKILKPGAAPSETFEFQREGELLRRMKGASNVVELLESSTATITVTGHGNIAVPLPLNFHVMELASACLEELLTAADKVSICERLTLWRGVVLGIHQMHLRKIVHRDLKSSNCLLFVQTPSRTLCKVADLGRSRLLTDPPQDPATEYLTGRGDFRFAPPEFLFIQGQDTAISHRLADLYGLGSVLFEVITGQCITSVALGFGPEILQRSLRDLSQGRRTDLSSLRSNYLAAYSLFESLIPSQIKQPAMMLIRQLCDPVPEARLPKAGLGKRAPVNNDLEWLIRRADILVKGLSRPPTGAHHPHKRTEGKR
jgi:serine/threonine protein kinase